MQINKNRSVCKCRKQPFIQVMDFHFNRAPLHQLFSFLTPHLQMNTIYPRQYDSAHTVSIVIHNVTSRLYNTLNLSRLASCQQAVDVCRRFLSTFSTYKQYRFQVRSNFLSNYSFGSFSSFIPFLSYTCYELFFYKSNTFLLINF